MLLYNTLHNRWLRLLAAVAGELLSAAAVGIFIVPLGLYTGGLMGLCQLVRTLLNTKFGISLGTYDLAGILYFVLNIPILLLAYKTLGRSLVMRTLICTVAFSLFYSLIPIPTKPVIDDMLTACMLGGILTGIGSGIVLTCGSSGGGLDVVGLCLSARGSNITVGKFSIGFNAVLYGACLFLFDPSVAIYSIIYNFFTAMTVYENMAFSLKLKGTPKDDIDRKVREAAQILDITEYLDRKPKALSGGQRQRVAIGRAIVRDPKVFLMDEPLSNLDAKLRNQMRAEIIKLRQRIDTTFIYVTHDQTEAMTLGDRIVIMKDGVIQQIGTPQEVYGRPANLFVAGFIGMPQMNFYDAQLVRGGDGKYAVELEGAHVVLSDEKQANLSARGVEPQPVTLGVRPEHILLAGEGNTMDAVLVIAPVEPEPPEKVSGEGVRVRRIIVGRDAGDAALQRVVITQVGDRLRKTGGVRRRMGAETVDEVGAVVDDAGLAAPFSLRRDLPLQPGEDRQRIRQRPAEIGRVRGCRQDRLAPVQIVAQTGRRRVRRLGRIAGEGAGADGQDQPGKPAEVLHGNDFQTQPIGL